MCRFLLLLTVAGIVLTVGAEREEESLRKRGWGDFWNGASVGSAVAVAVGRRDIDEERRELTASLDSPGAEKRSHLEDSSAEGMKKRDAYEGADRILSTRNNFESATRRRGLKQGCRREFIGDMLRLVRRSELELRLAEMAPRMRNYRVKQIKKEIK